MGKTKKRQVKQSQNTQQSTEQQSGQQQPAEHEHGHQHDHEVEQNHSHDECDHESFDEGEEELDQQRAAQTGEYQFVDRVWNFPLVGRTVAAVTSAYNQYGKESRYDIVKRTVSTVESHAMPFLEQAKGQAQPILENYRDTLKQVDGLACSGLDRIDDVTTRIADAQNGVRHRFQSGRETLETTVRTTADGAAQRVRATSASVKNIPVVRNVQDSAFLVEKRVAGVAGALLQTAEQSVDRYLPADASEQQAEQQQVEQSSSEAAPVTKSVESSESQQQLGEEARRLVSTAGSIGSKLRRRLYGRAMQQLGSLKLRAADTVTRLRENGVSLIEYAKKEFVEEHDEEAPRTFIGTVVAVPVQITFASVQLAQNLVSAVFHRAAHTREQAEDLYFDGRSHVKDASHAAADYAKAQKLNAASAYSNFVSRVSNFWNDDKDPYLNKFKSLADNHHVGLLKDLTRDSIKQLQPVIDHVTPVLDSISPQIRAHVTAAFTWAGLNPYDAEPEDGAAGRRVSHVAI